MPCEPSIPNVPVGNEHPRLDLPEGIPPLRSFYLYMTTGCNLCCRHCWITPKFVRGEPSPGDWLDIELIREAVREAKPMGLNHTKLTGGEPVLHPQFVKIVDFLTSQDIKLDMETNGTLIDVFLARHLKQNTNLWFISVSLDSVKAKKHDDFRGVQGALKETLRGIKNLVNAGYHPQIIMSLYRGNVHEIEDMVKLAVRLGAGSVKFNPVTRSGRGKSMDNKGELLDYEETMELVRFTRSEFQDRSPIPLIISTPPALSTIKELLRTKKTGGECHVLSILGLLGTGDMALCGIGRNIPELCFGKLGKENLRDVWISHPVLVRLRKDLDGDYAGICGDCIHAKRCLTHCVAMNYIENGNFVSPSLLCAEAEQRGEFPETRRRSSQEKIVLEDDMYVKS